MPALGFKKQFADRVLSGEKLQTIRALRKRPFAVGDKLHLYTGMRTKACRKLGEAVAARVHQISIGVGPLGTDITINGKSCRGLREGIAVADGFSCSAEMLDWFRKTHGLPFHGQLIQWDEVTTCS